MDFDEPYGYRFRNAQAETCEKADCPLPRIRVIMVRSAAEFQYRSLQSRHILCPLHLSLLAERPSTPGSIVLSANAPSGAVQLGCYIRLPLLWERIAERIVRFIPLRMSTAVPVSNLPTARWERIVTCNLIPLLTEPRHWSCAFPIRLPLRQELLVQ